MTIDDLDLIRHALGISARSKRGYRNYFVAGGDDVAAMERLRADGLVVKNDHYSLSPDPLYHVTLAGAKAIGLSRLPE